MKRWITAALVLAFVIAGCSDSSIAPLSRDESVAEQEVELRVGQVLALTLFEGGLPYDEPEISDDALAFVSSTHEDSDFPGGPPRHFEFRGEREGTADVLIARGGYQDALHFVAVVRR